MSRFLSGVGRPVWLGGALATLLSSPAVSQPDPALGRAQIIPAAIQGCEALSVSFRTPLSLVSQSLRDGGQTLAIRMSRGTTQRAENISADLIETVPPVSLGASGTVSISLDNSQTDPLLILRFPKPVQPVVKQTGERSIVITGISSLSPQFCGALSDDNAALADILPDVGASDSAEIDAIFAKARAAITAGEYQRATQLLTKIVNLEENSRSAEAQELLGVVRERNGRLAHARAEYEIYLEKYPDGEGADRVRQRLAGVLTALAAPPAPLRETDGGAAAGAADSATETADAQSDAPRASGRGGFRARRPRPQQPDEPEEPAVTGVISSYYYRNQGSTLLTEFTRRERDRGRRFSSVFNLLASRTKLAARLCL